jgi:PncC family amidohydrolase
MMSLSCNVIEKLAGKTLVTAESCTGGGIGAALTAVPGSSAVYKGGIISYTNEVKQKLLSVDEKTLADFGAVSEPVAIQMAKGAKAALQADVALSVTGLAGPSGDEYGNPVGTVFIGYCDGEKAYAKKFLFSGDREAVRTQAINAALEIVLSEL